MNYKFFIKKIYFKSIDELKKKFQRKIRRIQDTLYSASITIIELKLCSVFGIEEESPRFKIKRVKCLWCLLSETRLSLSLSPSLFSSSRRDISHHFLLR